MSWDIEGISVEADLFGNLTPEEVLYEFDGPKIFVALVSGRPTFVYESDSDEEQRMRRLLVVPTRQETLLALKVGEISLRDALDQPWVHAVDQDFENQTVAVWYLPAGLNAVPEGFKPMTGTLLSADLEQALRTNKLELTAGKVDIRIGEASASYQAVYYVAISTIKEVADAANVAPFAAQGQLPPWAQADLDPPNPFSLH